MWSEALSVLHEARWRGRVTPELADRSRDRLLRAEIVRASPRRLLDEAWRVAEALGWAKTHDAEYVALARLRDCPSSPSTPGFGVGRPDSSRS